MQPAAAVILRLGIAISIALAILTLWQWLLTGSPASGLAEAARLLFLFMDVGLGVWLVLLVVAAVRGWGRRRVILAALVGVVVNFLTVLAVGIVQSGALPGEFLLWALEAGGAFLVGAVVASLVVKAPARVVSAE